jgi:hypothetical protein
VRPIAAVARLGERVGRERRELLRREQLCDECLGVVAVVVEVVDDLTPLVSEVAEVLEADRTAHGSNPNWPW